MLTIGSQGSTVRQLQRHLNSRFQSFGLMSAMAVAVDGSFGAETLTAVKYLQCVAGFPVNGQVSEATWAFLAKGVAGLPALSGRSSRTRVAAVQRSLLSAGVPVTVDGRFGPKTIEAVKAYQQRIGLSPSGRVEAETWDAILRSRLTTLPCAALLPRPPRR